MNLGNIPLIIWSRWSGVKRVVTMTSQSLNVSTLVLVQNRICSSDSFLLTLCAPSQLPDSASC